MDNANRTGPINASSSDILDMRTGMLDVVRHDNSHEIINGLFLDEGKDAVRAKNGEHLTPTAKGLMAASERKTRQAVKEARQKLPPGVRYEKGVAQPASIGELEAEAVKPVNHSARLTRHLNAAGETKPSDAKKGSLASHHIVAVTDSRALVSRMLLFKWGIGINDVDNGVRLPRWLSSEKPVSLAGATVHSIVHTDLYHATVQFRLRRVANVHPQEGTQGRLALRGMKQELSTGTFPF
jgi:hypothetical protein